MHETVSEWGKQLPGNQLPGTPPISGHIPDLLYSVYLSISNIVGQSRVTARTCRHGYITMGHYKWGISGGKRKKLYDWPVIQALHAVSFTLSYKWHRTQCKSFGWFRWFKPPDFLADPLEICRLSPKSNSLRGIWEDGAFGPVLYH